MDYEGEWGGGGPGQDTHGPRSGTDAWGPKKFKNSGSSSLSLHTLVCNLKNPRCEG
jgi:hypothetical protein